MGACSSSHRTSKQANLLAHKYIIADGHVDLPYRLKVKNFRFQKEYVGIPLLKKKEILILSAPKKEACLPHLCQFTFPPPQSGRRQIVVRLLDSNGQRHCSRTPSHFAIARSPQDVNTSFAIGLVSLPMGMENGSPISTLADLKYFKIRALVTSPLPIPKATPSVILLTTPLDPGQA